VQPGFEIIVGRILHCFHCFQRQNCTFGHDLADLARATQEVQAAEAGVLVRQF
jgi:hypothetical protein